MHDSNRQNFWKFESKVGKFQVEFDTKAVNFIQKFDEAENKSRGLPDMRSDLPILNIKYR